MPFLTALYIFHWRKKNVKVSWFIMWKQKIYTLQKIKFFISTKMHFVVYLNNTQYLCFINFHKETHWQICVSSTSFRRHRCHFSNPNGKVSTPSPAHAPPPPTLNIFIRHVYCVFFFLCLWFSFTTLFPSIVKTNTQSNLYACQFFHLDSLTEWCRWSASQRKIYTKVYYKQ